MPPTTSLRPASTATKNIVISGTNYWNPGDDFVRDGAIAVLRELFPGQALNFLFYNFNPDFFPQNKFSGIANLISKGDLDQYRDFVDAIVVAGLSAGAEIKDLYQWVVANRLQDRVYLIGAGYENNYVARHIAAEPEATIFRNARIVLGRTAKTPAFMTEAGVPYHHINCPAILSVPEVKTVPAGKRIERIGFSIQLPEGAGLVNHTCAPGQYELAVRILCDLARTHTVEVVAHHKTEYFHFLGLLRGTGVPVVFSSFYQDLFDLYPRYDLVITTRLHSSLFANGHGIPGIIVNDTDRHTHTLEGFPHSAWVNTREGFDREFARIQQRDLTAIAAEARAFKRALLQRYVDLLTGPFAVEPATGIPSPDVAVPEVRSGIAPDYQFNSEFKEQKLVRRLVTEGMTVFDVGAHAGKYTRLFSLLVGTPGRVFAFEPTPASFQRLAVDMAETRLTNVTLQQNAVAERCGSVTLNQFPEEYSSWNGLGRPRMEDPKSPKQLVPIVSSVEVEAVTLDFFCRERGIERIDYLKLDVEGAEIRALQGARELLEKKAIRFLQFEISRQMLEGMNTAARVVFDYLARLGYECHAITDEGGIGPKAADSASFYENYIALAEPVAALAGATQPLAFAANPPRQLAVMAHDAPPSASLRRAKQYEAVRHRVEAVPGFLCPGQEKFLFDKVRSLPDDAVIVEIGSFKGRSTVAMGFACAGTRRHIFCIDTWAIENWEGKAAHIPPEGTFPVWQDSVRRNQLESWVTPLRGRSDEVLARWGELAGGRPIDFIFIDGSHQYSEVRRDFELALPLVKPGGWIAFHDVVESWPGPLQVWRENAAPLLESHQFSSTLACGRKAAAPAAAELPIHFFTIVLNGKPFIEHHIKAFEHLPFKWHWHVVEGVAELNHDTAWSRQLGGRVTDAIHRDGLSHDGTTEYLDELAKQFPDNVTLYRKPAGAFWDGKLEMVNAPLAKLRDECLLWQVDADELWTARQLIDSRNLFLAHPEKTAAFYFCHYFVGENLVVTTRNTYGNHTGYEWIRTWRFTPGCRWIAHEPPRLCRPAGEGKFVDLATVNALRHAETEAAGLVFQHYAYVTAAQLKFKETYYGYTGALRRWEQLQQQRELPVPLKEYFDWVKDGALVDTAEAQQIAPVATRDSSGAWQFAADSPAADVKRVLFVRVDSIGDAVLSSAMLPHLRRKYPAARLAVLCQQHVAELFTACPLVETIICFDRKRAETDDAYRQTIIGEVAQFAPDLVLNSTYSTDPLTEVLTLSHRAPQTVGLAGDLSNIAAADLEHAARLYSKRIPSPGDSKPELERHRDFLAGLGVATTRLEPVIWTSPEDEALADAFFRENQLDPGRTLALFPCAQHAIKDYPRYAEAVGALGRGFQFLILGGAEVEATGQQLARQLPGSSVNLAGKTTLREMAALLRRCRLYLGADSSGAHLACAVGTPNVVVLGGGHFGRFLPYSPLTSIACLPLDCYACNWRCRFDKPHCIQDFPPEVLTEAVRQTLAKTSAKPRVFVPAASTWSPVSGGPEWRSPQHRLSDLDVEIISVDFGQRGSETPGQLQTEIVAAIREAVRDGTVKRRVHGVISQLEKDYWLERNLEKYSDADSDWFDAATFLNWFAGALRPRTYLEVGVRRGRSMAQVLVQSPDTRAFGFDLWVQNYGAVPEKGIVSANPGPDFVLAELRRLGIAQLPTLISGSSHETLPAFFNDARNPALFDLIFVDGDHSVPGARRDLETAFAHLAPGGALVFDDICNPDCQGLGRLWDEFKAGHPDHLFIQDGSGAGTGVAFRPPLDRLTAVLKILPAPGQPELKISRAPDPAISRLSSAARGCLEEAESCFNQGDLPQAREWLERVLDLAPDEPEVLVAMANLEAQLGHLAAAHAAIVKAAAIQPDNPGALRLLADLHLQGNRHADAARTYFTLLQQSPDDVELLLPLGVCFFKSGDRQTAKMMFERVLELQPGHALARENLSVILGAPLPPSAASVSAAPALETPPQDAPVNEAFLQKQREFWNVASMEQAMFERVFTSDEISRMSRDEKWAAWHRSAAHSVGQILDGLAARPEWNILEVGCGVGRVIKPLRERFARVDGVDLSTRMIEFAGQYLADAKGAGSVFVNNGCDLAGLADANYDLVYSMIVFQHIRSVSVVRSYLREIRRVLKPGGCFKLQVHERREGFGRFDEEADGGKQYGFQGNGYTHDELRALLLEAGLEIAALETRGSWIWATARRPAAVGLVSAVSVPEGDVPLVTAIVSTYNSERFMRGCLEDLVGQTLFAQSRMEIIVVDSNSPQDERTIVAEFQKRHSNIVYIRTDERETVYAAWNRGLQRARGKYVTNANTDDRHRPDGLELLAQALERDPKVDLVYGDSLVTRSDAATWENPEAKGVFRWPEFDVRLLFDICHMGPHPMWRRSLHGRHGFFDPEYRSAGDYEFWLRLAVAGCRMKRVPEIVGIYLENAASISLSDGSLSWQESEKARHRHWPKSWGQRPATVWRSCEQPWPSTGVSEGPAARSGSRVLLACDFFWPSVGGVELFVEDLALRLRAAGCEVEIACRRIPERIAGERRGIKIHQLATMDVHGFTLTPAALKQFRLLLADGRFDAVIALSQPDNWLGRALGELRGLHPRVIFLPSINAMNAEEWEFQKCVGRVVKNVRSATRVVAVTENGQDARFLHGAGLQPVFVPHASEPDAALGDFRSLHGFDPARPLLVMVANFWPVKNHLELLSCLKDQPGDWQFVIIGHRIAHFGDYHAQVMALANADSRVRVMGGLPREQAAAAIRDADLLLVPSKGESAGPLVVLQAMSYGTPWISTPTCNATPDEAGGIVAPLDRFPQVIRLLLARADLRSELGRLGQAHWKACFTWDKTLPAFLKLVEGSTDVPDLRFPQELRASTDRIRETVGRKLDFKTCRSEASRPLTIPSGTFSPAEAERAGVSESSVSSDLAAEPVFSVIIPTCNRAATLRRCLDAVRRQDFQLDRIEVFVCDDGSKDGTRQVVEQLPAPFPITYLHQKNSGPAAARNLGIRRARGKYLLILNDDAVLEPDAFRLHLEAHQQQAGRKIAVLGRFTFPQEFASTPFGYALEHSELLFFYRRMKGGQTYDFNCFFTCNISLPRAAMEEAGLFDERFAGPAAEDIELGYRLFQRGYRVFYEPRCIAWHHHPMTAEGFCRTHQIRGQAAITLMIVQPDAPWYPDHDFSRLNEPLEQLRKAGPSVDEVLRLIHKSNELPAGANTPEAVAKRAKEILPLLRFLQQYHELAGMLSNPRLPELIAIRNARRECRGGASTQFRPAVSVVITCYNYAHFLAEAVESVTAQTYRDFEIIIVNDGSTDNSADVARDLIRKHGGRCRMSLLDGPNSGQPAASRNNGVRAARGRFILCLDADDKIDPTFLAKAVPAIEEKDNIGVVYSHIRHFGDRSDTYACGEFDLAVLAKDNVLPYCALYRRELWEAVDGYRLNVRGYEDWDFWLSLCERGWKGRLIPEPLFLYRKHGSGLLANANEHRERLLATIVRNHPRVYNDRTRRWADGVLQQNAEQSAVSETASGVNLPQIEVGSSRCDDPTRVQRGVEGPDSAPERRGAAAARQPCHTDKHSPGVAPGKPRLRITYLISNITGVTGGNQTLLRQADEMHRRGHEVTIVTYSPKPAWFKFQLRVIQVPVGKPLAPSVPPSEVVVSTYFTNTHELLPVKAPVKIYYAQGDQFIFGDSTMADTEMNRKLGELSRASYLAAGVRFVPNSRNLANAVEQMCGRRADGIVPVCTDQTIFRPLPPSAPGSRCRILIVGPDLRGTAAEPLTFKGIQDTCDALKILAERGVNFTAIRMSSTRPEIFADCPCEFHVAPDDDAKTRLYGTADILIYASHYDSCPRPPQEAMAAGCAVICTATPGAMEYCRDGRNALLVPVQSPQAIADAVERLIADPALRDQLVKGGLATAAEHPREREWNEWESILYRFVDEARLAPANGAAKQSGKRPGSAPTSNSRSKRIELPACARLGHLAGARDLFNHRKLVEAWSATLEALNVRPFHPEAWLLLSEIAETSGDASLAKGCADRARKMAPGWKPARKASKGKTAKANAAKTVLPAPPDWIAASLAEPLPAGPGGTGHRPVLGGNLPPSFVTAEPETNKVVPSAPNAAGESPAATGRWPVPPPHELHPSGSKAANRPSLTVCLIARNEEKFIGQCLESIRGLAQQVVVVDTGSTDWTKPIAERFGAEVYSFVWCDDFSAARNAALERATGDWILFLDADEELLPDQRDNLLKLMGDESAIAFRLPMIDKGREDEGVSYVPRLFRNAPGLFYVGRVHEQVFSSVEVRRAEWGLENKFGDATLLHHGYTKELVRSRDKIARNLRLLQLAVEEMPGEPNLLMNLGLELVRDGRLHEGLQRYAEAFRALAALPGEQVTPELRESLLTQYCTQLVAAKNYAKVASVLQSPLAQSGGLTATLHWLSGLACIETKNFGEGAEQMRQCLAKRSQPALSPVNKNIRKAGPGHCLAICLAALKRTPEADAAFQSAVGEDPQSRPVRFDYARFLASNGQEVEALKWLHQLMAEDPSDTRVWQLGGQVALSKPEFLEFACDWTGEAIKLHGGIAPIVEQRATALLLSGDAEKSLVLWQKVGTPTPHRAAALLICQAALARTLDAVGDDRKVNLEFIAWYRRLLAARSAGVLDALNERLEGLREVVPAAVETIEMAMAEASAVPAK